MRQASSTRMSSRQSPPVRRGAIYISLWSTSRGPIFGRFSGAKRPSRRPAPFGWWHRSRTLSTRRTRLGLVHRDVKPGNILVTERDGERARLRLRLRSRSSRLLRLAASPAIAASSARSTMSRRNRFTGDQVDRRTHVYSLGCVLFECLVGARPFERESELAVVFAHLNDPPPRPTEFRPDLPAAFDEFFATALAKEPNDASARSRARRGRDRRGCRKRRRSKHVRKRVIAVGVAAAVAAAIGAGSRWTEEAATRDRRSARPRSRRALSRTPTYYRKHFGPVAFSMAGVVDYPTMSFQRPKVARLFPGPYGKKPIPGPHQRRRSSRPGTGRTGPPPDRALLDARSGPERIWRPLEASVAWI